jgi:hypothetical protein
MKPKMIIIIEGGFVREVLSDIDIDIAIMDYDIEGIEEEHLTSIPSEGKDNMAFCYIDSTVVLPGETEILYNIIETNVKLKNYE